MIVHQTLDDMRAMSDSDLLQRFFHSDTRQILAECNGSLQAVCARKTSSDRQRTLLAGIELARRAALEDMKSLTYLSSPTKVKDFLRLHFFAYEEERFCALWVDAQNRLLKFDELFRGTLTQTSVYPREIAKRALQLNACAVVFAHNHPSGVAEPSRADESLTELLKRTLLLVDVKVVDHVVVAGGAFCSFAERGLL